MEGRKGRYAGQGASVDQGQRALSHQSPASAFANSFTDGCCSYSRIQEASALRSPEYWGNDDTKKETISEMVFYPEEMGKKWGQQRGE